MSRINPIALEISELNNESVHSIVYFAGDASDPVMSNKNLLTSEQCLTVLLGQLIRVLPAGSEFEVLDAQFPAAPNSFSLQEILQMAEKV
jgi:hypothetical protein